MPLTSRQSTVLLVTVFVIATCGIMYELIIGSLSSYLLGNSITHFSMTIGLFLSSMGLGAWLSQRVRGPILFWFVLIELGVGLVGGMAATMLYAVFSTGEYFYVAMTLLILLLGSLLGMEIPIVVRILGGRQGLTEAVQHSLANVLAFDYLGALLASAIFPLVLLPRFGLLITSYVTGLINVGVTLLTLLAFRRQLRAWRLLLAITAVLIVLLIGGILSADPMTAFFESQLYEDPVIYSSQTAYQRIIFTRWGEDVRLFLDGNLQFSALDEYRYHELLVHPAMTLSRWREQVLVLGGGDGLAAREILKYPDVQRLVLVDIDPAMTDLAHTFPTLRQLNEEALHDPRVQLVHDDAFNYLEQAPGQFGVIIIDLPDPNNESLGKLYSRQFYTLVRKHLSKEGMMVTQATSPYFARQAFWGIATTVESAGLQTQPYHVYVPSFGDWGFVLAAEHRFDPADYQPLVETRFLTPPLLAAALQFDADTSKIATDVSTLDNQSVVRYYEAGWRKWN